MKNNTKIRLHLSKQLFESLAAQVIAESKKDMSGGAYTEAVKQPKAPKMEKAMKPKEEGKVEEVKDKASKKGHDLSKLKSMKKKLDKKINEMETITAEEDGMVKEDASNEIMQVVQKIPEFYELLRAKAQMAPHEFDVLMSGIGAFAGTSALAAKAAIKDLMNRKKAQSAEKK